MTNTVLKYNTYRSILPSRGSRFALHSRAAAAHSQNDAVMALLMRASIVLIVALLGVYIAEKSSMVFSQRIAITQEQRASTAEKDVSNLEITATQLAAAHNLTDVAASEHMVIPQKMSYLNVNGDSVALAR